jgi:surface antigen
LASILTLLALAVTSAACSFSYKLDSVFARDKSSGQPEYSDLTGAAIEEKRGQSVATLSGADLALAKAAASEAVRRNGKDVSVPWENPTTGARGMVTPLATAYTQNGVTCRDFLASYVQEANEAWLEGDACRIDAHRWEVRNLKPWKRS